MKTLLESVLRIHLRRRHLPQGRVMARHAIAAIRAQRHAAWVAAIRRGAFD